MNMPDEVVVTNISPEVADTPELGVVLLNHGEGSLLTRLEASQRLMAMGLAREIDRALSMDRPLVVLWYDEVGVFDLAPQRAA